MFCSGITLNKVGTAWYSFEQVPANSPVYPKFIEANPDSDFSAVVKKFP